MAKNEPAAPEKVGFTVDAVRAYFNTVALQVLQEMQEQGTEQPAAALMTGLLEAAAQVWMQTSLRVGVGIDKARTTAMQEFLAFLLKWGQSEAMQRSIAENQAAKAEAETVKPS